KEDKKALLVFYLIFLHHSSLMDFSDVSFKLGREVEDVIIKQREDLDSYWETIIQDLNNAQLSQNVFYPEERKIRKGFKIWQKRQVTIQDYFLINYLFSLLIEADKLDASDTEVYALKPIRPSSVDDRFGKPTLPKA